MAEGKEKALELLESAERTLGRALSELHGELQARGLATEQLTDAQQTMLLRLYRLESDLGHLRRNVRGF